MNLRRILNQAPLLAVPLLTATGFCAGTGLGWIYGSVERFRIIRDFQRQHPGQVMDCGTGIVDLPERMAILGAMIGLIGGFILGCWFYTKLRKQQIPPEKTDWQSAEIHH